MFCTYTRCHTFFKYFYDVITKYVLPRTKQRAKVKTELDQHFVTWQSTTRPSMHWMLWLIVNYKPSSKVLATSKLRWVHGLYYWFVDQTVCFRFWQVSFHKADSNISFRSGLFGIHFWFRKITPQAPRRTITLQVSSSNRVFLLLLSFCLLTKPIPIFFAMVRSEFQYFFPQWFVRYSFSYGVLSKTQVSRKRKKSWSFGQKSRSPGLLVNSRRCSNLYCLQFYSPLRYSRIV